MRSFQIPSHFAFVVRGDEEPLSVADAIPELIGLASVLRGEDRLSKAAINKTYCP